MKVKTLLALGTWALLCPSWGQVTVDLKFDKEFFIPDEPMMASVRITNFSGRTLVFGEDNQWLQFGVEMKNGFLVDRTGDPSVIGRFEIPNASQGTRRVNLAPYFRMTTPGRYKMIATVFSEQLNQALQSSEVIVNIVKAAILWQREFGVPTSDGEGFEVRKYVLIRALNNNRLELYIRVASQDDAKILAVFSVGNLVAFGAPEAQVDRLSRLHLLQQYGARSFRYLVVTADGELMVRQRYDYAGNRPRLAIKKERLIGVSGGVRVVTANDLPPKVALAPTPPETPLETLPDTEPAKGP